MTRDKDIKRSAKREAGSWKPEDRRQKLEFRAVCGISSASRRTGGSAGREYQNIECRLQINDFGSSEINEELLMKNSAQTAAHGVSVPFLQESKASRRCVEASCRTGRGTSVAGMTKWNAGKGKTVAGRAADVAGRVNPSWGPLTVRVSGNKTREQKIKNASSLPSGVSRRELVANTSKEDAYET